MNKLGRGLQRFKVSKFQGHCSGFETVQLLNHATFFRATIQACRKLIILPSVFLAAALVCSCTSPEKKIARPPNLAGKWDFSFFQLNPNVAAYLVEVTRSGGDGAAMVQVISDKGDHSAPALVNMGVGIALGTCGLNVIFSDTGLLLLDLRNGDSWSITTANGTMTSVQANPDNTSAAMVTTSGTYTCLSAPCPEGVYETSLPLPWDISQAAPVQDFQLDQVNVSQDNANLSATIAEQKILSLYLVNLAPGDTVRLCYARKTQSDEQGESFFSVRLVNEYRFELIEDLRTPNMTSPETTLCHGFTALGAEARADFIFSLADLNDSAWIDTIRESVNGIPVYSYDFEDPSPVNDLAPDGIRWQLRRPVDMTGQAQVSTVLSLAGNSSYRAVGGTTMSMSGSVLEGSANMLGGLIGGLGGGGAAGGMFGNTQGVSFSINDGQRGGYLASFAGALPDPRTVMGTFTAQQGVCIDQGQFIAGINSGEFLSLASPWSMTLVGQAQNCGAITNFTRQFSPFTPVQKADRFYSDPQVPVVDDYLNQHQLSGRMLGAGLYFTLSDFGRKDYRSSVFYGVAGESIAPGQNLQFGGTTIQVGDTTIQVGSTVYARPGLMGAFNGWLGFDSGWKCQGNGIFMVTFP